MTSRRATSRWGRPTAERWLAAWAHEPLLLAESLRRLPDPLAPLLAEGSVTTATAVVAAMASSLQPAMAADAPPAWLRADQVASFRRSLAAVRQYGGALLAEPVGTGKSWIALAVVAALGARRVTVLAPSALVGQWQATAARVGIAVTVHSHETISRGRLPAATSPLILIDESHWFRNAVSKRYQTLAPWLTGSRCLLLSATPVVNHPSDLTHQLRLCLRDDALAAAGLPSLRRLAAEDPSTAALAEVIISGHVSGHGRPALRRGTTRVRQDRRLGPILRELDRLGLSTDPGVAALVRTSLWGAAASSPAALAAALLRYLALLDHAEDAARTGRRLGRDALRHFIGADPAQLVLWELLPAGDPTGDLILADRPAVARLRADVARAAERPDAKLRLLHRQLTDGRPTVVFTGSIATVGYLWRHLGPGPVAWCTGGRAGIGATFLPREAVLAWFAPGNRDATLAGLAVPRILVSTDVAAEGLDLQAAERVIHYDLPWTAVRSDQRIGRVHRLGSLHALVEEHWLLPPRVIARRLGLERSLSRKRHLPLGLGIGEASAAWWRRRQDAVSTLSTIGAREGQAMVVVEGEARTNADALACIRIDVGSRLGATRLLVHDRQGGWRTDEATALELLAVAARSPTCATQAPERMDRLVEELAAPVRAALREAAGRIWDASTMSPATARLLRRLRHWARIAARARDAKLLEQLDHAVRGLGRGMTAGEEILLARLAAREQAGLPEHLAALPRAAPPLAIPTVRLVGLVVFTSEQ